MLERILVVRNIVVIVVQVCEEVVVQCKDIFAAQIGRRQIYFCRIFYHKDFFLVVPQIFPYFVPEICIRILVSYYFYRRIHPDCPVVGCNDYLTI